MNTGSAVTCHATAIVIKSAGVLLRGDSGAGKSMLAAILMNDGAHLVADDHVRLVVRAGRLIALAPSPISGLLELRGIGPVRRRHEQAAVVRLIVDLVGPSELMRLPDEQDRNTMIAGIIADRLVVPAPGLAGSADVAQLLISEAIGGLSCHKPLHLPPVSP